MKYLDICKRIGDLLVDKNLGTQGLMNGKAGVALFLYSLSEKLSDKKYADCADRLILDIYKNKLPFIDFYGGAMGICWSLLYIIEKGFCEGEADEILVDADDGIYMKLSEQSVIPLNLNDGLTGYLFYLIMRLRNGKPNESYSGEINVELLKVTINRIEQLAPDLLQTLTKDIRFALLEEVYVFLLSLKSAFDLGIYKEKIVNVLTQLESYWISSVPYIHFNRLYLGMTLLQINQILKSEKTDKCIRTLLYSLDINELRSEIYIEKVNCVNTGYLGQILILNKCLDLLDPTYPNYDLLFPLKQEMMKLCNEKLLIKLDETFTDFQKKPDWEFGLLQGWAGVGLALLSIPEIVD